jgi:hypothetical protein
MSELRVPADGMNVLWLKNVKDVCELVADATRVHGAPMVAAVDDMVRDLQGSARGAWAIRHHLCEVYTTWNLIEGALLETDCGARGKLRG